MLQLHICHGDCGMYLIAMHDTAPFDILPFRELEVLLTYAETALQQVCLIVELTFTPVNVNLCAGPYRPQGLGTCQSLWRHTRPADCTPNDQPTLYCAQPWSGIGSFVLLRDLRVAQPSHW
jgi:hypothetical protein